MVVAHVILVSALGPNPSFFFFGGTLILLGGQLGQGLGLGPGLDNSCNSCSFHSYKHVLKSLLSSIALHIDY